MNDLFIGTDEVVVSLDHSEVRLIMKALDELRYSEALNGMDGSQLVNLAWLSNAWMGLTTDVGGKRYHTMRPKTALAYVESVDTIRKLASGSLYGKTCYEAN